MVLEQVLQKLVNVTSDNMNRQQNLSKQVNHHGNSLSQHGNLLSTHTENIEQNSKCSVPMRGMMLCAEPPKSFERIGLKHLDLKQLVDNSKDKCVNLAGFGELTDTYVCFDESKAVERLWNTFLDPQEQKSFLGGFETWQCEYYKLRSRKCDVRLGR